MTACVTSRAPRDSSPARPSLRSSRSALRVSSRLRRRYTGPSATFCTGIGAATSSRLAKSSNAASGLAGVERDSRRPLTAIR